MLVVPSVDETLMHLHDEISLRNEINLCLIDHKFYPSSYLLINSLTENKLDDLINVPIISN